MQEGQEMNTTILFENAMKGETTFICCKLKDIKGKLMERSCNWIET
jgi:hypothetical protein